MNMAEIIHIATKRWKIGLLRRLKNNSKLLKILKILEKCKWRISFLVMLEASSIQMYQEIYSFLGIFKRFCLKDH